MCQVDKYMSVNTFGRSSLESQMKPPFAERQREAGTGITGITPAPTTLPVPAGTASDPCGCFT